MEYKEVSKQAIKAIKQILEYTSKDSYRKDLFLSIKVSPENDLAVASDGRKLAYVKLTEELKRVFGKDGTYTVKTGNINYKPIIAFEENTNKFPDNVYSIRPTSKVIARIGLNPSFLKQILKYADDYKPVELLIFEDKSNRKHMTIPIEILYEVNGAKFDTLLMPMVLKDEKVWRFEK